MFEEFKIEILLTIVFAGLLFDWFVKSKNIKERAFSTSSSVTRYLSEEFALVDPLFKNSPLEFYMHCSGRKGLDSCLITLSYKNTFFIPQLQSATLSVKDVLSVKVVLRRGDLGVFALFLKKNSLDKKKRWDLDQMTTVFTKIAGLSERYTVCGDNLDVFSSLLKDVQIKEFLSKDSDNLLEITCSDSIEKKPSRIQDIRKDKQEIVFTFLLNDKDLIRKNMEFVLRVVDVLSLIALDKDVF